MTDKICPWCGKHYDGHHMSTSCSKLECKDAQLDNLKKTRYAHQVNRRQTHPEADERRCPLCCRAEKNCKCRCSVCGSPLTNHVKFGRECRKAAAASGKNAPAYISVKMVA